jgi:hypothetical protein
MASRTNKQWIAKKKSQQQKQAARLKWSKRFEYPKRKLDVVEAKELGIVGVYTNPKGATYNWFIRWRKICWETRLRTDPDGYRYIRTPSWWSEMVSIPVSGRLRTRLRKSMITKK